MSFDALSISGSVWIMVMLMVSVYPTHNRILTVTIDQSGVSNIFMAILFGN